MNPTSPRRDAALQYVVGVDIGGTKINAALADRTGTILSEKRVDTIDAGAQLQAQLSALIADLSNNASVDASQVVVTAIGGAGALSDATGELSKAPNLSQLEGRPLIDQLSESLGHDVLFDNDLNMTARGELEHGIGRHHDDFVAISIGTGLGMGIVVDRKLVRGVHGAAGEIGFLPMGTDPFDPANQLHGPLEEIVSGRGLEQLYHSESGVRRSSHDIFALSSSGDDRAQRAVDTLARWTAAGITATVAVLDPSAVVLGGGIGTRRELLERITDWLPRFGQTDTVVQISALGVKAPVLGAIHAANEHADNQREDHP